jgi:hypothetical protein
MDKQTCAASHPSADREAARAAADSIAEVVADADLAEALALSSAIAESATRAQVPRLHVAGPSSSRIQTSSTVSHETDSGVIEIDSDSDSEHNAVPASLPDSMKQQRRCPACTYLNLPPIIDSRCAMCGAQIPVESVPLHDTPWACAICTLENNPHAQRCDGCDFPRERRDWAPKRRRPTNEGVQPKQEAERSAPSTWTCELCTLVNVHASRVCSICEAPCPLTVPQSSGSTESRRASSAGDTVRLRKASAPSPPSWDCRECGQRGIAHEFWMCGGCGWIKENSSINRN